MKDFNTLTISGRLTRDPELKQTNNGTTYCKFSIASNRSVKQGNDWKDEPGFFDCVAWKHSADFLVKHGAKGDTVYIVGELRWSQWEKDGVKISKVEVQALDLKLSPKRGDSKPEGGAAAFDSGAMSDDSIPF